MLPSSCSEKLQQLQAKTPVMETTVAGEVTESAQRNELIHLEVQEKVGRLEEARADVEAQWKKPRYGVCAKCRLREADGWFFTCGHVLYCSECRDEALKDWAGFYPSCGKKVSRQIQMKLAGFTSDQG